MTDDFCYSTPSPGFSSTDNTPFSSDNGYHISYDTTGALVCSKETCQFHIRFGICTILLFFLFLI